MSDHSDDRENFEGSEEKSIAAEGPHISVDESKQDADISPRRQVTGPRWALIIVSVLASTFLFGLDNTTVVNVQPTIINRFDAVSKLPWISVAFLVGSASTTLFWGAAYGQANAKWLYVSCAIIFEVASAVCGAAPNMVTLIVGHVICGLGGTGMYTGVLSLLTALTVENERASYFGLSGLVWGAERVLGPIIGARIKKIDSLGTILLAELLVAALMGMSFGGVLYDWGSGQIIALFVVAGVLTLVFLAQQAFAIVTTPVRRAFPLEFFRGWPLSAVFILGCCSSTLTYITIYFIPLYFQFVDQDSAIRSEVKLLLLVILLVISVVINGFAVSATGRYAIWFFAGGALSLIGSALHYTVDVNTSDARLHGYSIIIGAAIMLSVVNAIFLNETSNSIVGQLPSLSRSSIFQILAGVGSQTFTNLDQSSQSIVLNSIVLGLSKGYVFCMTAGALSVVLAVLLKKGRLWNTFVLHGFAMRLGKPATFTSGSKKGVERRMIGKRKETQG